MSEAIPMMDRVAAAICRAELDWKSANGGDNRSCVDCPDDVKARAALLAMRDPTVEMLAAALPIESDEPFTHEDKCLGAAVCLHLGGPADVGLLEGEAVKQAALLARDYRRMIDAVLAES